MAPKDTGYLDVAYQRALEKKTHVSFPQLKYPSLRDGGWKHPVQWLDGKAMDDGAEGLWRVYDKLYDLTEFVDHHPGGSEWLELCKGTDITEAFECHHLTSLPEKMLEKYYIRDAKTPRNSPFTFEEDGLYKTLKREVVGELKKIPKDVHKRTDRIIDRLFGSLLLTSALALWFTNYWLVMGCYLIASISLAMMAVAAHNYLHKRSNWRMYLFNFTMWSYRDFRVSHALSHHLYPNTLMDFEVSSIEPIVLWNPGKKPFWVKYMLLIQLVYFPFMFMMSFLKRFGMNFARDGFFKNHFKWHDFVGFLLPVWMYVVTGAPVLDVAVMWLWIHFTSSLIFFLIGANAAHHHPAVWKDGDEYQSETRDWGEHEIESLLDRTDINSSYFRVLTFFGDHTLHHLFPTLDHAALQYLYPLLHKYIKKHNVDYKMTTFLGMCKGQLEQCKREQYHLLGEK